MTIIISGATGFVGQHLVRAALADGHRLIVLSRNPGKAERLFGESVLCEVWDGHSGGAWEQHLPGAAVVNLAGENIGAKYWTHAVRDRLVNSRIQATTALVRAVAGSPNKPDVMIQASAVGYYGSRGNTTLAETAGKGTGFLADLTEQWEEASEPVEAAGVRRVVLRTGIVLAKGGGVLTKMQRPYKLFMGGAPGKGSQYVSWIHMKDLIAAIKFLLDRKDLAGIFNLAAPEPVRMAMFCQSLGKALKRPNWLPVPERIITLVFGDMGRETILGSQRVLPERLQAAGFSFAYPTISGTMESIYGKMEN